ncbi:putative short-chain dehydrogenase [Annulohypoxylon moriforme]|nr:putative short-chain dehydrogenase [Annulohypoxylon moriforme]
MNRKSLAVLSIPLTPDSLLYIGLGERTISPRILGKEKGKMAAAAAKGVILVTGANGGLGSAIVEQIASKAEFTPHHGIYAVRDTTHAPALSSALAHGTAHSHDIVALDLTKLDDVREVAQRINDRVSAGEIPPIRALILNAGFQDFGNQSWTGDGLDTTFAANYLGHWLLTLLLLKSIDKENGRIVVVGSQSHDPNDPRNVQAQAFDDPKYKTFISDAASYEAIAKGTFSPATEDASFRGGFRRYGAAKLFLIMMQHELQQRLNADPTLSKICVLGVDPGTMISGLQRLASWPIRVLMFKIIYPIILYLNPNGPVRSTSRSAADVLEATFGVGEEGELSKDKYFNGREPFETSEESRDAAKRELVWEETVELAGLKGDETVLVNWQ